MSKLFGVKCTDEQAEQFERAAEAAGKKTVTAWLRDLGAAAVAAPYIPPVRHVRITGTDLTVPIQDPPVLLTDRPWSKEEIETGCAVGRGYMRVVDPPPDVVLGSPLTDTRSARAIELANSIPGLKVGFGAPGTGRGLFNPAHPIPLTGYAEKVEARREELKAEGVDVLEQLFPADTPEEPVRSWSEEFARFRKMGDFGADALAEATEHIKKWPKGFKTWNEQKQVGWLDEKYPLTDSKGDGW